MPVDTPPDLLVAREAAARLVRRREDLIAQPLRRAGREDLVAIDRELIAIFDRVRIDHCDASPDVPLVLLPVRIETKIAGSTLRVRITPDEIHVDALARTTTPEELSAGQEYWRSVWPGESPAAWGDLIEAVGERRAGWIAHVATPTNLAERPGAAPVFPSAPGEISAGTVARCLPDRFVVRVFVPGRAEPVEGVGNPIAREVPISPLALGDETVVDAGALKVAAGSEWTVDFTAAVAAGFGVVIDLPRGTSVIESVVVVGTRNSVAEDQNAADLTELMVSHAYSDGFGLLPHGTPTNNADAERSPYGSGRVAGPPSGVPRTAQADALAVAGLLGVDADVLESVIDPSAVRSTLASTQAAANSALWWATWEYVLQKVDEADIPAVTPRTVESARQLHRDHVRPAGHAPTLRVGAQVYGLLPVADLEAWRPRGGETTATLVALVSRILRRWTQRAARLPHVGPGDDISDAAMLEMLGTSPVSTGVRARLALDGPQVSTLSSATGAEAASTLAELQLARAVMSQYSIDAAKRMLLPPLMKDTRRIPLPLVSERDSAVIAEILADLNPKVDSVLQALLEVAWDRAKDARFRAAPSAHVSPLLELLQAQPEITALITAAASEQPIAAAVEATPAATPGDLFTAAHSLRETVHFDGQPTEAISLAALEPTAEARTSLAQVALELGDTAEARWMGQNAAASLLEAFAMRWEASDAMKALGAAPIDERRIAVASALDIAAHRVDAWATGIAAARHRTLAASEGITIGAFGYVENIPVVGIREPQGWLHAPSTSHAVAGGVLASAHQSNIGAKAGQHPFAIDLTSRRGVALRRVLEGVHAGQTIGALLGYEIERGLKGSAARFQLTLRQLAPMSTDELSNDAASAERTSLMAAADVVDGVELLRLFPVESLDLAAPTLRAALATPPANLYLATPWIGADDAEWAIVRAAIRAASETLDAVSDALLAESVLQYSSGNPSRAAVAMDAIGTGAAVDPALGVLGVRQAGRSLTHRVIVIVPESATGWSAGRPRAIAEPRVEAWAAARLGDPAKIIVTDDGGVLHTLDEAGFAALDLVFADDAASLDRDLRAAMPAIGDTTLAATRHPSWPAGAQPIVAVATLAATLRSIVAGAAPVDPQSLVAAGDPVQHAVDPDEILSRCDALLEALESALESGAAVILAIDPDTRAIAEADVGAIRGAVAPLAAFGVALNPDPDIPSNATWAVGAWEAASARLVAATAALADLRAVRGNPLTPRQLAEGARAIGETVLGDGFPMLPLLIHTPLDAQGGAVANDFQVALSSPAFAAPPRSRVGAFIRDHAGVRPAVARVEEAQLIGQAIARPLELMVVQLTFRSADGTPAPGTARWLAGDLPDDVPWPAEPATHVIVDLVGAADVSADRVAGIAIDSWVETLPFQPDPRSLADDALPDNGLRAARATTGLAIHANQASARAPQVILSAVAADGRRWTTDTVVAAVRAAVGLSKARLVTYENVPGDAAILPAAYVASPWLQPRKGFAFHELAGLEWAKMAYPFLSEVQ